MHTKHTLPKGWTSSISSRDWRAKCSDVIRCELASYPFAAPPGPNIAFYGSESADEVAVIAVFDTIWSLHVQRVLHGQEEAKYGLPPDHGVISLDVGERPQCLCSECAVIADNWRPIRQRIYTAVAGAIPALGSDPRPRRAEHLVWETVPLLPSSSEQVVFVGRRIAAYTHTLMPLAQAALALWARESGERSLSRRLRGE